LCLLLVLIPCEPVIAQEVAQEKESVQLPPVTQKIKEPFDISPEFRTKKEEIESPEIQVTGIMETEQGILAIVEFDLENYEGTAILEPGQKVTMPDPKSSEGEKWISHFRVKRITRSGMTIVLENGKEVCFPVLGSRD
jgi:hypothetical protein